MLAEITGPENVTTVEVDAEVAAQARRALGDAGFPVEVITQDGVLGYPPNAPYDRIIATASVRDIPYAWVEQTRPGGLILMPWGSDLYSGGALLRLTARSGGTATGRVVGTVAFMRLRDQHGSHVAWLDDERDGDCLRTTTSVDPRGPLQVGSDARFAAGARMSGVTAGMTRDEDGGHTYRLSHYDSGSWAAFVPGEPEHVVRQRGPRRLWDELEAAYAWWLESGRPEPERFGVTITREGQCVWLDVPERPIAP